MKKEKKHNYYTGYLIFIIVAIVLIAGISTSSLWFSTIDFGAFQSNEISGSSKKATIIDENKIFEETYYAAISELSKGVYYGTSWLEICPNSQELIDGEVYLKVCDSQYSSLNDLKNQLKKYVTASLADELTSEGYIDYEGNLYIKPITIPKNDDYVGLESYNVKNETSNTIEFTIKSNYKSSKCVETSCVYNKTQTMKVEKEGTKWLVSSIEMPY